MSWSAETVLDGTIPLSSFSPTQVTLAEFRALCEAGQADGRAYICRTTLAGSANSRLICALPEGDGPCSKVVRYLGRENAHAWNEEFIVLLNFPCYLVTGCGAVVTEDGRVIAESVYPSAGEKTLTRFLGLDFSESSLEDRLLQAQPLQTDKVCSTFFSRWGAVYFHAISESLVQQYIYKRAGLTPFFQFIAPPELNASQRKLVGFLESDLVSVPNELVRVPRAAYCTVSTRHAALSFDFRSAVESMRVAVGEQAAALKHIPSPGRIYVSRLGESQRPLLNEDVVSAAFAKAGFSVLEPHRFSLAEQVKLFSNASVVAGPHGAGLLNAAFAKSGALLFELRGLNRNGDPSTMNESYRKIAAIMGLRYGFLVIENDLDSDVWSVPEAELEKVISLLSQ